MKHRRERRAIENNEKLGILSDHLTILSSLEANLLSLLLLGDSQMEISAKLRIPQPTISRMISGYSGYGRKRIDGLLNKAERLKENS